MPFEIELKVHIALRGLDPEGALGELPGCPGVTTFGDDDELICETLQGHAATLAQRAEPRDVWQQFRDGAPVCGVATVEIQPPEGGARWREPVSVEFGVVRVRRGTANVARVPALDLDVFVRRDADFDQRLEDEIRAAIARHGHRESLGGLVRLAAASDLELVERSVLVRLPTARERQREDRQQLQAAGDDRRPASVLREVGVPLRSGGPRAFEVDAAVARLAELLTEGRGRSVLLVGSAGVGKSALVDELFAQRAALGLGGHAFHRLSGSQIVAGQSGFGAWQERCQKIVDEARAEPTVLVLGNLVELIEAGRGTHQPEGIADFLRPFIARGDLLAVAECHPEQWRFIEREHPSIALAFARMDVEPPGRERALRILRAVARSRGAGDSVRDEVLHTIDRLHGRFAPYSQRPGRVIRFFRALIAKSRATGASLDPGMVAREFSASAGMPERIVDDAQELDLEAARAFFAARVLGQDAAVERAVDLLATIKSDLTRPRRPIASLLLAGPTGVGKTELTKALAEYLFGDRDRMLRFDMSEFATASAVQRLLGGLGDGEGLLVGAVRDRPFAVVLFDEFEKAHPTFFDLLLPLLGEGRLTDTAGRTADLCSTVVVMTSNLGAEGFGRDVTGFAGDASERSAEQAVAHFTGAVRDFLRPEIFNRIDRVVPFLPLDRATVERIAARDLETILQRDGLRFADVEVDIDPEVVPFIAGVGFDPLLGARPLQRAIEREIAVPLAAAMSRHTAQRRIGIRVEVEAGALEVRSRELGENRAVTALRSSRTLLVGCVELRRRVQRLLRCSPMRRVDSLVEDRLREAQRRNRRRAARHAETMPDALWQAMGHDSASHVRLIEAARELEREVQELEASVLLALHEREALPDAIDQRLEQFESRLYELLREAVGIESLNSGSVTVAAYGRDTASLLRLVAAYRASAEAAGHAVKMHRLVATHDAAADFRTLLRFVVPDERARPSGRPTILCENAFGPLGRDATEAELDREPFGFVMQVLGNCVALAYSSEAGRHEFVERGLTSSVDVVVRSGGYSEYYVPDEDRLMGRPTTASAVRRYHHQRGVEMSKRPVWAWSSGDLDAFVASVLATQERAELDAELER